MGVVYGFLPYPNGHQTEAYLAKLPLWRSQIAAPPSFGAMGVPSAERQHWRSHPYTRKLVIAAVGA